MLLRSREGISDVLNRYLARYEDGNNAKSPREGALCQSERRLALPRSILGSRCVPAGIARI